MVLHSKMQEADDTPIQTIMDACYADEIALLANTPTQAKSLQHSLDQVTLASM